MSPDDCDEAIAHFERAIQLDPNFALAYDGLGACHVNRVFKGFGGSEDYERAEQAFTKALAIDPNIFEARMLMVFVYLWRGKKQKAREEVNRARREAPNEPVVHFVKALLHRLDGEYGRALRSYDRLVRLDPAAHVVASYSRALVHMYMGHFDETFRELDTAGDPDNALVRTFRALALVLHRANGCGGGVDERRCREASEHAWHSAIHGDVFKRAGQARRSARADHAGCEAKRRS